MSKDPAFLFYSSDFLTGTFTMTNEQVGIYIRLLCLQHQQKGVIDKDSFRAMANGHKPILAKFVECDEGYYNARMREESDKRNAFCESRRSNAKHKQSISKAYAPHMENENENENINKKRRFSKPNIKQISDYCKERKNNINAQLFFDSNEAKGWVVGSTKTPMKDWKAVIRTWEQRGKDEVAKQPVNNRGAEIYKHFDEE